MADYWFDANFFIPAQEKSESLTTLKEIIRKVYGKKDKYTLKITKQITYEIKGFLSVIQTFFTTVTVNDTPEFRVFRDQTKHALGFSKAQDEPADCSLAYQASQSTTRCFIVSNDEGFLKVKTQFPTLMKNVEIVEPTNFLKMVMLDVNDDAIKDNIKALIIHYAEHFITYRLSGNRSIARILESLLVFSTVPLELPIEVVPKSEKEPKASLSNNDKNLLNKYFDNQPLNAEELNRLKPIQDVFKPLAEYYNPFNKNMHKILTKSLYLSFPEILLKLRQSAPKTSEDILNYTSALKILAMAKMFEIRIKETAIYFKECYFDEAFFHFRPLLEFDWNFTLRDEEKSILKFLYGIFLLNVQEFDFFAHLFERGYWNEYPRLNQIFRLFFDLRKDRASININALSKQDLRLMYNLGLYYCNTNNAFGLQIFKALFELNAEALKNLEWHEDFLKRYLLELRIHQETIIDAAEQKFLSFLTSENFRDHTKSQFDSSSELKELTPIETTKMLFRQPFYFIRRGENLKGFCEAYCWNDNIRSIVLLYIPEKLETHLENVKIITIKSGNIMTKSVPREKKQKARIVIVLSDNCELEFQRFTMEMEEYDKKNWIPLE